MTIVAQPRIITLSDEDKAQAKRWTPEHALKAGAQGWDMFDYDQTGALQIQSIDDSDKFANDDEALAHIAQRARKGDELCQLAMELDRYFEPIIYGKGYKSKIHR